MVMAALTITAATADDDACRFSFSLCFPLHTVVVVSVVVCEALTSCAARWQLTKHMGVSRMRIAANSPPLLPAK